MVPCATLITAKQVPPPFVVITPELELMLQIDAEDGVEYEIDPSPDRVAVEGVSVPPDEYVTEFELG
ncbi:unannotated protein [freshwater metagenome]|uniref:Unannotated protein n=1 Tax=freshwater metagenome TaxID=449393 RepID=A0A6J7IQS9_9ZZZZ